MLFWLFLLFILVPLVELALLLYVGSIIGPWWTLGLVIVTGAAGATLARVQGWQTYRNIHRELGQGRLPTDSLLDALMIFLAGAFLLTPGILTDLFGFSLLLPPCRRLYRTALVRWFKSRFRLEGFDAGKPGSTVPRDQIIDSYVVDHRNDDDA